MNCRPGDLAVVVFSKNIENVGAIVRCIRLISDSEQVDGVQWTQRRGGPCWLVESEGRLLAWGIAGHVRRRAFADALLRPIRDPGEDAQDETLLWKPVPLPEIA